MKKFTVLILLFIVCNIGKSQTTTESSLYFKEIITLIEQKNFFKARDLFNQNKEKLSSYHQLITEAYIDNAFNQLEESNKKIKSLFRDYKKELFDSLKLNLFLVLQDNSFKLHNYKEAKEASDSIIIHYANLLSAKELEEHENGRTIGKILENQPKQKVTIKKTTTCKIQRDKAGLANLMVKYKKDSMNFIFDTGANISTVTETMAKKMNMKILNDSVKVGTITGNKVTSGLAICPEFWIGNIKMENIVFLIFKDEDLAFSQIQYQINGIIGFPVIEAFGEVRITKNEELIVPEKPTHYPVQNMALDFLNPILQLGDEYYIFDTGATETMLYKRYFTKHEQEIRNQFQESEVKFGGAGGVVIRKAFKIDFFPVINGKKIEIKGVSVFSESNEEKGKYEFFYGNIGQDLIKKFNTVTLNFHSMYIKFD